MERFDQVKSWSWSFEIVNRATVREMGREVIFCKENLKNLM